MWVADVATKPERLLSYVSWSLPRQCDAVDSGAGNRGRGHSEHQCGGVWAKGAVKPQAIRTQSFPSQPRARHGAPLHRKCARQTDGLLFQHEPRPARHFFPHFPFPTLLVALWPWIAQIVHTCRLPLLEGIHGVALSCTHYAFTPPHTWPTGWQSEVRLSIS